MHTFNFHHPTVGHFTNENRATSPNVHTFNSYHTTTTVAVLQMRRAAYPTVHIFCSHHPTVDHFTNEKSSPYPTVHTFNFHHPTVAILQMRTFNSARSHYGQLQMRRGP